MDWSTFFSTFSAGWLLLGVYGATLALVSFKAQFQENPPQGILKTLLNSMIVILAIAGGPIYLALVYHDRLSVRK